MSTRSWVHARITVTLYAKNNNNYIAILKATVQNATEPAVLNAGISTHAHLPDLEVHRHHDQCVITRNTSC